MKRERIMIGRQTREHARKLFYYWYQCLLRSDDFLAASEGRDAPDEVKKIFDEVGNIHEINFDDWWLTTGTKIQRGYCLSGLPYRRIHLTYRNTERLHRWLRVWDLDRQHPTWSAYKLAVELQINVPGDIRASQLRFCRDLRIAKQLIENAAVGHFAEFDRY